jgi:predicted DCC family thiol-disulfide oxidoreductase YuxK
VTGRRHLLLYDGVCGLCDRLNRFVLKRDRKDRFRFAPLQSGVGRDWVARFGGNPDELSTFRVVVEYEGEAPRMLSRGRAGLFVLRELGGVWGASRVFGILPTRLLDWGYERIAKNRYRLFGRHDACPLPRPEHRAKFLAED